MNTVFFVSLIVVAYLTGRQIEVRHFRSLRDREERYQHIPLIASRWQEHIAEESDAELVGGSVVVGADYFKTVVSGLRGIFGGNMKNYEALLDRGRREALLRMLAQAEQWNADQIINVRVETSVIGNQGGKQALPCIEIHAYGTAIRKKIHEIRS